MHNLFNDHRGDPLFQADGNYGATSGVAEMLLQSQDYVVAPLPAMPAAWSEGSYRGMLARGNFEVSAQWSSGHADQLEVLSTSGGTLDLEYPNVAQAVIQTAGGQPVNFVADGTDQVTIETAVGETYVVTDIPANTPVPAPSNLTIDQNRNDQVKLSWTGSAGAASYNVYRAVGNAPDYELVAADVEDAAFTYESADLATVDQMTFKVTAVRADERESDDGATVVRLAATPAPAVTTVAPTSGTTAGGTTVTLTGTNLTGATGVTFDGAAGTSLSVTSATKLTVKTPAHAAGVVDVVVTTPSGTSPAKSFTYGTPAPAVTSVSPAAGTTAGGTSVTLAGTNFTGATGVTFDGVAGTSLSVTNDGELTITTPAHAAGAVDVVVTTPSGSSPVKTFTYLTPAPAPAVTNVSPVTGSTAGGTTVTLTGTNFTGATGVTFDGMAGTSLSVANDGELTVKTPAHVVGVVDVIVTTPFGASAAETFTYVPAAAAANLALGQPATQVSTYPAPAGKSYAAASAVDGNLTTFSATNGSSVQPWWQVDLGSSYVLDDVAIYNRTGPSASRLVDFYVLASEAPFASESLADSLADPAVWSYHQVTQAGSPTTIPAPAVQARYVRVQLAGTERTEPDGGPGAPGPGPGGDECVSRVRHHGWRDVGDVDRHQLHRCHGCHLRRCGGHGPVGHRRRGADGHDSRSHRRCGRRGRGDSVRSFDSHRVHL